MSFPCSSLSADVPRLLETLDALYPAAECGLRFEGDPWRLLVMAVLSAQCTDKRVNLVAPALFARYPTPAAMADAPEGELETAIQSCGLYRAKAKNLRGACRLLADRYGSEVPRDMDALLSLPGVGRKIANLIRGDVFGLGGIVADTHCIRLSSRLGFTPEGCSDPLRTEKALAPLIPSELQADFCHRLVLHGRAVCTARAPDCAHCPLNVAETEREGSR